MFFLRRCHKWLIALSIQLLVVAAAAYGFAVSNPLALYFPRSADQHQRYAVSNISYLLDGASPDKITEVTFNITPDESLPENAMVQAKLLSSHQAYVPCVSINRSAGRWACRFSGLSVVSADELDVRVVQPQGVRPHRVWLPIAQTPNQRVYVPILLLERQR